MATMTKLTTSDQLQSALEASTDKPLLLFKHSTRCPISSGAYREMMSYLEDQPNEAVQYGLIHVVEDRPVSMEAADRLGVQHESPQVILVQNQAPIWHTSHSHITSEVIKEHLQQL
ncbi:MULTISPECIES: bacillithiol system redox-active protein YtxJ [Paenibacillus]|uniref:bacillithiol system redox-active protein YtxJ n=1 Tax=Paenibacillus TaxID=44249 RepID=UPI000CF99075|nr:MULTISPECIES: bacillithiol system redox-active protein YtxJ [Paenibacillus]MEC0176256.1 bacillithiol system redox-active protein YtxJ [Paenibacillus favisporus]PQP87709.1 bacillithiol system redox-active protein YtxJ [Paenibacillus sp. AR247]